MGLGFVVYVVELMGELVGEGGRRGCEGLVEDRDSCSRDLLSVYAQDIVGSVVTLCFEACICEIVGFRFSSSNLEFRLDEVLFLLFLCFGGFAHCEYMVYQVRVLDSCYRLFPQSSKFCAGTIRQPNLLWV